MKFKATIREEHEPLYWKLFEQYKHNHNEMLATLFKSLMLCEAMLRQQEKQQQEEQNEQQEQSEHDGQSVPEASNEDSK